MSNGSHLIYLSTLNAKKTFIEQFHFLKESTAKNQVAQYSPYPTGLTN